MGSIPPGERPRERLLERGEEVLSDGELIAVVLQSGARGRSALDVARDLLRRFGSIEGLARASWREVAALRGVGAAKAARIQASIALGRRARPAPFDRHGPFRGARDVFERLAPRVVGKEKETFYTLLLDSKNRLLREEAVSIGTLTASLVHPREVFRTAIRESAASMIVAHNHPSGDPSPSPEDLDVTARLRSVGEVVGIPVVDHVILGSGTYTSLAERGRLDEGAPGAPPGRYRLAPQ